VLPERVGALKLLLLRHRERASSTGLPPLADAKGFGYALLGPSLLFEFEGPKAPSLAPVGSLFRK
jgi:hypothetical protein